MVTCQVYPECVASQDTDELPGIVIAVAGVVPELNFEREREKVNQCEMCSMNLRCRIIADFAPL